MTFLFLPRASSANRTASVAMEKPIDEMTAEEMVAEDEAAARRVVGDEAYAQAALNVQTARLNDVVSRVTGGGGGLHRHIYGIGPNEVAEIAQQSGVGNDLRAEADPSSSRSIRRLEKSRKDFQEDMEEQEDD